MQVKEGQTKAAEENKKAQEEQKAKTGEENKKAQEEPGSAAGAALGRRGAAFN